MAFTARKQADLTVLNQGSVLQRPLVLGKKLKDTPYSTKSLDEVGHDGIRMFMHYTISRDLTGTRQQISESILANVGELGRQDPMDPPGKAAASASSSDDQYYNDHEIKALYSIQDRLDAYPELADPEDYVSIGGLIDKLKILRRAEKRTQALALQPT